METETRNLQCKDLDDNDRIIELETELDNIDWDIIGLSETRQKSKQKLQLQSGNMVFWKGTEQDWRWSGFSHNKNICGNVEVFKPISERIASISLQFKQKIYDTTDPSVCTNYKP